MNKGPFKMNHSRLIVKIAILFFIISFFETTESKSNQTNRPKIGLVLSGGGARGFAHIGILKTLDSLHIPIDYITGTSMGGILGALYAIGYTGSELEALALQTDWLEILSDKPPRSAQPYFQKVDGSKYVIEFGLDGLKPTLPTGLIVGQKLSLLFSSLTFAYEKTTDFDHLPIPFRCVAIDLYSGNEVILKKGSLAKAMRSTMAIPTVFSAVEYGDSLLMDGGIINNIPVDVVQDMGADIIIAVDVMGPQPEQREIHSFLDVMQQTMGIVGMDRYRNNVNKADILIQPDLTGFTSGDFLNEKIQGIIQQGDLVASKSVPDLIAFKELFQLVRLIDPRRLDGPFTTPKIEELHVTGLTSLTSESFLNLLQIHRGDFLDIDFLKERLQVLEATGQFTGPRYEIVPQSETSIRLHIRVSENRIPEIKKISIQGSQNLPMSFIRRMLGLQAGDILNLDNLNERIMRMYGLGYFQYIRYNLETIQEGQVHLILLLKEWPKRIIRIGGLYNDYHQLVLIAGLRTTNFPLPGVRFDHEFQFAGLTRYQSKVYYPSRAFSLPIYPLIRFSYKDIPTCIFNMSGNKTARYKDRSASFSIGLGFLLANSFNLEVEFQQEHMNIKADIADPERLALMEMKDRLRKLQMHLCLDLLDNMLVPRRGIMLQGLYEGSYKRLRTDIPFTRMSVSADLYSTFFRRHTTRIFGFWGTGSSGLPIYKHHNLGKPEFFIGMPYDRMRANRLTVLRFDYRFEIKKNLFLKLMGNIAFLFECHSLLTSYTANNLYGFGVGVKFALPFGIIEAVASRGSKNFGNEGEMQNVAYITMGTHF